MSVAFMATLASKIASFKNTGRGLSFGYTNLPVRESGVGRDYQLEE
jgi:hypothetical protein